MRIRVQFRGRVQGVGFRATAQAIARGRPVSGWVHNEPDDSVLMEVQGTPEAVESVLASLREGMRRHITTEQRTPIEDRADESGFVIRHERGHIPQVDPQK